MLTVKFLKRHDKLLLAGYSYRRANKSQHATLILGEQPQASLVKLKKQIKYRLIDENVQILASTFSIIPKDIYFKRATAPFNF